MNELIYPEHLSLYPFQEETIRKTLSFFSQNDTHSVYVASSPGLGKSITSVVTANTMGARRILIVCPSIMRLVWEDEINRWSYQPLHAPPSIKAVLTSADISDTYNAKWVIISYDLIWRDNVLPVLQEQEFDLLIADEAHYLKARSKRTKCFFKELFPRATSKLLLSGTPFTTNVVDCYRPFHYMLPKEPTFSSLPAFVTAYSYEQSTPWGVKYHGLKNADNLSKIIRSNFFIRYKKEDVLTQLPPVQFTKVLLPEEYSVKMSERAEATVGSEKQAIMEALVHDHKPKLSESMSTLRRLQGETKIPAVAEYAEEMLEQDIPLVIFAHHKSVISEIEKLLKKYNPVVITGETGAKDRQKAVDAFQNADTNVAICNLVAGGVGITLTRSNDVLLAEAAWTAAENQQAISRCHRIGTRGIVTVHWFIVKDSIDEDILNIVMRRTREFSKVFDENA